MTLPETYALILALCSAAAAGCIGSFALMKRMSLAGDAISHVALPGIGIALAFHFSPILGAGLMLFVGAVLIWNIERLTPLNTDTTTGVIFSAAIAFGALLIPTKEELIDALFGNLQPLGTLEFALGLIAVAVIFFFIARYRDRLILSIFSPELAEATGIKLDRLNLYYLLAFSLTVLLGLRSLGALLMGSLIIIPAAIGRQLTHTFAAFLVVSAITASAAVAVGFFIATSYSLEFGPTIVATATVGFCLSLFKKKK